MISVSLDACLFMKLGVPSAKYIFLVSVAFNIKLVEIVSISVVDFH